MERFAPADSAAEVVSGSNGSTKKEILVHDQSPNIVAPNSTPDSKKPAIIIEQPTSPTLTTPAPGTVISHQSTVNQDTDHQDKA